MSNREEDKAGRDYWDETWAVLGEPQLIDIANTSLANEVNIQLHRFFTSMFAGADLSGKRVLEIGCARSVWLPYFALQHGLEIWGLDYSEDGCRQEELLLSKAGVHGTVIHADLFQPPSDMRGAFDYVISFGVVEHFTDPSTCIRAMAAYLKPGGTMMTLIPNMNGLTGMAQRLLDKDVFDIHVPIDDKELALLHEKSDLDVKSSEYFLSTNFYVVNIANRRRGLKKLVRIVYGVLGRISMLTWWLERKIGSLPRRKLGSPYVICVAEKR